MDVRHSDVSWLTDDVVEEALDDLGRMVIVRRCEESVYA